jgi:hypothetical protein
MTILSLTRQFLNCWLEYVLSQPVDFDISVMIHFLRSYLGIPILMSLLKKHDSIVDGTFLPEDGKEMLADLIPQESYS